MTVRENSLSRVQNYPSTTVHDVTSRKTIIFIVLTVRMSNFDLEEIFLKGIGGEHEIPYSG
jgi:hypothetical protein